MSKETQLHEALAVRSSLQNQAKTVMQGELQNFKNKQHLFEGFVETFYPNAEGEEPVTDKESKLTAAVQENFKYGLTHWLRSIECEYQVERGNQLAKADVEVDGITLFKDAPATFLLVLSKHLKEVRNLIDATPTMDMKMGFEIDSDFERPGVYKSNPINRRRVVKTEKVQVVVPPTDKHPAQTRTYMDNEDLGRIETIHYAGKLTPAEKAARIDRIDRLIQAVDKARSVANRTPIDTTSVTKKLYDFLVSTPAEVNADAVTTNA